MAVDPHSTLLNVVTSGIDDIHCKHSGALYSSHFTLGVSC